jgi:hypothetical protein
LAFAFFYSVANKLLERPHLRENLKLEWVEGHT